MALAMPKDDWTPEKLKAHREWRARMFSTRPVAPPPEPVIEAAPEPDPTTFERRIIDLEATVNRLRSEFIRARIDRSIAEEPIEGPRPVRLEHIIKVVAKFYNVTMTDMRSRRRLAVLSRPRQVAMYLCRQLTIRSLPEIGRHLGGKDHTTVLHGVRKIETLMLSDPAFCQEVAELEALFA